MGTFLTYSVAMEWVIGGAVLATTVYALVMVVRLRNAPEQNITKSSRAIGLFEFSIAGLLLYMDGWGGLVNALALVFVGCWLLAVPHLLDKARGVK